MEREGLSAITNLWFLARTYTFVNHTWWMGISTFQFKHLFNFLSDPLNSNFVYVISKTSNIFIKCFENSWFFEQYGISTNTTFFGTFKETNFYWKSNSHHAKNAFFASLKALFVLKILRFCHDFLVMYEKGLIRKDKLTSKFMTSQPG